jgi:hypothetical protein
MDNVTEPDSGTREAEREDAARAHNADRPPSPDEEAAAERGANEVDANPEEVAEHYEEMADLGAHVKGEGQID